MSECWGAAPTDIPLSAYLSSRQFSLPLNKKGLPTKTKALCCSWMLIIDPVSFHFSSNNRRVSIQLTRSELFKKGHTK